MLALSRRVGESIIIDGQIKVSLQEISGNRVRLAVMAPREIPIHRSELLDQPPAEAQTTGTASTCIK